MSHEQVLRPCTAVNCDCKDYNEQGRRYGDWPGCGTCTHTPNSHPEPKDEPEAPKTKKVKR